MSDFCAPADVRLLAHVAVDATYEWYAHFGAVPAAAPAAQHGKDANVTPLSDRIRLLQGDMGPLQEIHVPCAAGEPVGIRQELALRMQLRQAQPCHDGLPRQLFQGVFQGLVLGDALHQLPEGMPLDDGQLILFHIASRQLFQQLQWRGTRPELVFTRLHAARQPGLPSQQDQQQGMPYESLGMQVFREPAQGGAGLEVIGVTGIGKGHWAAAETVVVLV